MNIQDVQVVSVPVSDLDRAKAFYVNQLGFDVVRDDATPEMRWIQVRPPQGTISLVLANWFESMPAGSLRGLVLNTTDIEGDYQKLSANGVGFDQPPTKQDYGTEAVIRDPDGNRLVLLGF